MTPHYHQSAEEFCVMGDSYARPDLSHSWIPRHSGPECDPPFLQASRMRWHSEIDIVPVDAGVDILVERRFLGKSFQPEEETSRTYVGAVRSFDVRRNSPTLQTQVDAEYEPLPEDDERIEQAKQVMAAYSKHLTVRGYNPDTDSAPASAWADFLSQLFDAAGNAEVGRVTAMFARQ